MELGPEIRQLVDENIMEALSFLDNHYRWWQVAKHTTETEKQFATLKRSVIQTAMAAIEGWQPATNSPNWGK